MITLVPNYYKEFRCLPGRCSHTCCVGWEIDIDGDSLPRFLSDEDIAPHVDMNGTPHIRLEEGERCPFLNERGLCDMILRRGESFPCQICRDHPRFRNFWTDRVEIGLGLVCEEAARIILSQKEPLSLDILYAEGDPKPLPPDERWLWDLRREALAGITETGPRARLKEYLIFRYLPDALYDGLTEERLELIDGLYREVTALWDKTDGSLKEITEVTRQWSYDVEYDDGVILERLKAICEKSK